MTTIGTLHLSWEIVAIMALIMICACLLVWAEYEQQVNRKKIGPLKYRLAEIEKALVDREEYIKALRIDNERLNRMWAACEKCRTNCHRQNEAKKGSDSATGDPAEVTVRIMPNWWSWSGK